MEQALIEIIVNGKVKKWYSFSITYEQVVMLAYGNVGISTPTVTYIHGDGNSQGSLTRDDKITAVHNMIFNVINTDKA